MANSVEFSGPYARIVAAECADKLTGTDAAEASQDLTVAKVMVESACRKLDDTAMSIHHKKKTAPDAAMEPFREWLLEQFDQETNPIDYLQMKLVSWCVLLESTQLLQSALVDLGIAEQIAAAFYSTFAGRVLETLVSSGMADSEDPANAFRLLLVKHFPTPAQELKADAPRGFDTMPMAFVLEGLPGNVIALNGLYVYQEMCEKKPAYVLAGSKTKYYIYWAPQYKRWYVGPTMGSGNILCYKDSTKSKLEPTFPFDDPYGAMSFWNGDKWATDDASVKFVALESMWRDDPV